MRTKPLKSYIIIYAYEDKIGRFESKINIKATSRKHAEEEFYKFNRPLIKTLKNGKKVYDSKGGYTVVSVLTLKEWIQKGKPYESDD